MGVKDFLWANKYKLLIFFCSFFIFSVFKFDPDLGWHLAIGQHFLKTGEIIRKDQFSWTAPGYIWGNSYFFYQIFVSILINNLGFTATVFIFSLISSLAVLILLPKKVNFAGVLFAILGSLIALNNAGIRPHTISFLIFAILIRLILARVFWQKKFFWFWFLFFALWANWHNAYLLGLFALVSFRFIEVLSKKAAKKKTYFADFFINSLAAFTGTFATPFGTLLWLSILNDALFPKMYVHIAEFLSIAFFNEMSIIYSISGIVFIYIIRKNFVKIGPSTVFLSAFFFMLPVLAVYFAFFWSAIFIFISTRYIQKYPVKLNLSFVTKLPIYLGVVCLFLAIFLIFLTGAFKPSLKDALDAGKYPISALEFMQAKGYIKNVFNQYEWGGFIDWRYSSIKVFVDGRMTGWHLNNRSLLQDYLSIKEGKCGVVDKYEIDVLLINKLGENKCFPEFERVYDDNASEVWIRKS